MKITKTLLLPSSLVVIAGLTLASQFATETAGETAPPPPVPYPDGYRQWMHISSAVTPPEKGAANSQPEEGQRVAPHGLIHHIYANEKALEGYRTGHFPEGAVLIADWFILEEKVTGLVQGPRKSINVMFRAAHYSDTGGWGFEDFDKDSHTTRNVGPNAVQACFECHTRVKNREYVFSVLKP
jgi:Cytochrome P460